MTKSLQDQSPAEIDSQLAELYHEAAKAQSRVESAEHSVHYVANDKRNYVGRRQVWGLKLDEAIDAAEQVAVTDVTYKGDEAQRALDSYEAAIKALDAIKRQYEALDDEFDRRGGWTRAFIVTNGNGHVHSSMHCGTCFPTTQFGWLPQVSGQTEDQIVDAAGEQACTVCYPSAPVRPSYKKANTLETADQKAAREAREAHKVELDAKKAKAAEKALVVSFSKFGYKDTVRTVQSAWNALVSIIVDHKMTDGRYDAHLNAQKVLSEALIGKLGQEEFDTLLAKKVAASIKRWGK